MSNVINVIKHNGSSEPLDISKATASLEWAVGDLTGVSVSEIEIQSKLQFFDGINTSYITDIFIKTCDDLADLKNPNYDIVARNLKLQKLYKQAFKSINPPRLLDFLNQRIAAGEYSANLIQPDIDYDILEQTIDHKRDFTFSSSGLDLLVQGYGVCKYETPQFIFMAIAIDIFRDYHKDKMKYIIDFYNALSTFDITLPSPEMKALRTDSTDYASCITFRTGDAIESWKEADNALVDHTCASAGIGVDIADISSIGDKVKKGKIKHSGKIKVLKSIDGLINKSSQNGRRGHATAFVNFFDPEIEKIMSLKSPRIPVEDRINDLSYGIKVNQFVYDRAKANGVLSLFSVRKTPKLLELFYSDDVDSFTRYYEECEAKELYTHQISAQDFFNRMLAVESTETSSYYIINIDEMNANSAIPRPITQANICVEYMTATLPISRNHPNRPDVGVCVLGNANQGTVTIDKLPHITDLLVRAQSHIMQRQVHPTSQANAYVKMYRDIGLGLSNHAFWLANQGLRYGQPEALYKHNEWMEHFSYNCHVASHQLAVELGAAPGFVYHSKLLPIHRYKRTVDELVLPTLHCDWETLEELIQKDGMYNVGLMMVPPAETSAGPSNQTTGLEPIRNLLTLKDKSGPNYKQFAPDALRLADKYDYVYDSDMNERFIKHVAITQKWIDKGISANTFYNPEWVPNKKVLAASIIKDLFLAKYYGWKTRYYQNTKMPDEQELAPKCAGEGCSV